MGVTSHPVSRLFDDATAALLSMPWRSELSVEEIPAPQRIAPYAVAIAADVNDGPAEVGSGRLVLLHDPEGNPAWEGTFRCVTYARADVDADMGGDPLLAPVGWSWLMDALERREAAFVAPSGTVTAVSSQSFGSMASDPQRVEVEIRASWTPLVTAGSDIAAHVHAWQDLLCMVAGLPLLPDGVRPDSATSGREAAPVSTEAIQDEAPQPSYLLVSAPAEGIPMVVESLADLRAATAKLASATGPLAVDTERAQGFRYSGKAYLIQLRRAGVGTVLIDPVALEGGRERADLSDLADELGEAEWIIHAAQQDLPCLAEVDLLPRRLFDTELAGRLLGFPRVSLTSLTERALGKTLAKEHSAADWSKRPLPGDWLSYAALDVELLADLRDWVADELDAAGKSEWARQEFAFLVEHAADPPNRREDPWRRTSGIHDLKTPGQLAIVRELWETRDEISRRLDRAPGRVLPDSAISEIAARTPASKHLGGDDLRAVRGFSWRLAARYESSFVNALDRVAGMSRDQLPPVTLTPEGPPPPRTWAKRFPEAYARWGRLRAALLEEAQRLRLPVENLISPDAVRRLVWEPPPAKDADVESYLAERLVRPWQRELVTPVVTPLLEP